MKTTVLRANMPAGSRAIKNKIGSRDYSKFRDRLQFLAIAVLLAGIASPVAASNGLSDGGFDSEGANVSTYCYMNGSGCASGPWTGSAILVHSGNAGWGGIAAQSPSTLVALQMTYPITQTFTATASGNFRVVWYEADRPTLGGQTYNVSIGGTVVAASSPSGTAFVRKVSNAFSMTSGTSYTITFQGTTTSGDHSALIDSVDILPANDTSAYSYDALGRLVSVAHGGAINTGIAATYSMDAADNRTNVTVSGAPH